MPTAFTHIFIAGATAGTVCPGRRDLRLLLSAVTVSLLPDADVLGLWLGVPYEHFFGHRGFFHSICFALIAGLLCMSVLFRHVWPDKRKWCGYLLVLFCLGASHGLLDAMTDGGLGIALLSPLTDERIFLPVTPIPVAPLGLSAFFSSWGMRVMLWEIALIWVPVGVLHIAAGKMVSRQAQGE